jgi:hypothetical protein
LSVNIKFICTSFRNRQNSEPLASFSGLFRKDSFTVPYIIGSGSCSGNVSTSENIDVLVYLEDRNAHTYILKKIGSLLKQIQSLLQKTCVVHPH